MSVPLAFISMTEKFGGHEVMLARWLTELQRQRNVAPVVISGRNAKFESLLAAADIPVHVVQPVFVRTRPMPAGLRKLVTLFQLMCRFVVLRARTGARDAVVSEGSLMSEPLSTIAARLVFRRVHVYVPMVESFQALGYPDANGATRRFLCVYRWLPNSWITLSDAHGSVFRLWSGVKQPVHVLRNTTAEDFDRATSLVGRALPRAGEPFTVLVLGRLSTHHKGLDFLLAHVRQHMDQLRLANTRVMLVGEGEFRTEIDRALASHNGLAEVLSVSPWASPLEAYAQADCVLLASRIEGVPLVMLEAMLLGLPVVASDLPGTRAYLDPECLFPVGDMGAAFDRIEALKNPHVRARQVSRNLASYHALASAPAFARNVTELSKALLA